MNLTEQTQLALTADHLHALMASVSGGGFEAFSGLTPEIQDNLLNLAATLANDLRALIAAGSSH